MARLPTTLARLFPPPEFMTLPAVGVDISDTSLKYMQFERKGDELALKVWGDLPIKDGVVVQGVVKDPATLAQSLIEVRRITGTPVMRLSLPEERAYLFEMRVKTSLSHDEVLDTIEFHLEENVPLSAREAEFDYTPVPGVPVGGERSIIVTAYGKETVAAYVEACGRADVLPLALEVEAQALARSVVHEGDASTCLLIDFGKTRTGIGIISEGVLHLTSTVDIGGEDLDVGLKQAYPLADPKELIRMKNEYGILPTLEEPKVREALMPSMVNLKNEIVSRIGYWDGLEGKQKRPIVRVILCGGIANLAGLPSFLEDAVGLPVEQAEVWNNVFKIGDYIPPITKRYSYGYATVIGLALSSFVDTDV